MKLSRRLLALLICVLTIVTVLPVGIFAEDETLLTNDYDVYLPFETSSWVNSYFTERAAGSNLVFAGNADNKGTYWSTYKTEENGNKYVYQENPTNCGYTFANASGYDNFSMPFQISFRMKLESHSETKTTGLYIPVLRGSIAADTSTTSSTGTANILAIANTADYPGEAIKADGSKNLIGYLIPGKGNSTGYTHTGYGIYSGTWYEVTFMGDKSTGKCWFSVTDGTNEYELAYSHSTMKGLSILNKMMLFRTYQKADAAKLCLDDVRITNIKTNFDMSNNMSGLTYAVKDEVTQKYASDVFPLPGFTVAGTNNSYWELITEQDGNKYLSHRQPEGTETHSRAPITMSDSLNLMDGGDFALSYDFKWGAGVPSNGSGMLSLKIDAAGDTEEFRIINMSEGGGLYFGPATWSAFKIGTLTTPDSEGGAKWHNIKVVFKPYVETDYIDMNYEFYIDQKLAAYTDVIKSVDEEGNVTYSHNFYTKQTGVWTVTSNLRPAKYVEYLKEGDTNSNGVEDEGETFVYAYKWLGDSTEYDIDCSWGSTSDNIGRVPVGLWDGYEQVNRNGTETEMHRDGQIATLASFYMFHWNSAAFDLDNVKFECLEEEAIESAELVGYQLGTDGTSVRFIACVDSLDFAKVGMDIQSFTPDADMESATTVEPLWTTKVDDQNDSAVFIALTADGEQVGAMEEFGARFFAMLAVKNINSSAIIRVLPYTMKNGLKNYGAPVDYMITYADGAISVKAPETFTPDYSDEFDSYGTSETNGYCYTTWSAYKWDTLSNPIADVGGGGEGGYAVTLDDDGSVKITARLNYKEANKYQETVPVLDETTGEPTYDENGDAVTQTVDVTDADGNVLYKEANFSRRIKFAYVIPTNLEDYKGYTFVITAKIKATQINCKVKEDVVVGEGEDAVTYNVARDVEDSDGQCGFAFGFMTDYKTSMLAYNTYVIKNDGEWIEIQAAINVNDALLAHASVTPKEADQAPVTDAEGKVHYAPLRPTINLSDTVDDGYLRECYVKDLTLTVIPTPAQ